MSENIKEIKNRDIVSKLHDRVMNDLSPTTYEKNTNIIIGSYYSQLQW